MTMIPLEEKLQSLPQKPGVYLFKNSAGKILYIGKAKLLRNRVRSYFQNARDLGTRKEQMVHKIHDFEFIVTDSEVEALILEANLVKEHHPRYNVTLRDDKSFPYIRVTNEPFPRVFPTRKRIQDGSKYFGPYTDVKSMRHILKMIRKLFPIRSCNHAINQESIEKKKIKICLDYHIHKCQGPCEGLISQENYGKIVHQMVSFLNGKVDQVMDFIHSQIEEASQNLRFEDAARLRDQLLALESFTNKQKMVSPRGEERDLFAIAMEGELACGVIFNVRDGKLIGRKHFSLTAVDETARAEVLRVLLQNYYLASHYVPEEVLIPFPIEDQDSINQWLELQRGGKVTIVIPKLGQKAELLSMGEKNAALLLEELKLQKMKSQEFIPYSVQILQKELSLPRPPRRIEAFDISNIMGKDAVASMVTFHNGQPHKSEYRRFKIKSIIGANDFAMIAEVVSRRYSRLLKENTILPDLILIDGGKGQLSAAVDALEKLGIKDQPIAGLAKRFEEIYLPGYSEPQSLRKDSSGLKLLQRIRDESHRFAITYHRKLREAWVSFSELDSIPQIGKIRKQNLLKHFGSISRLSNASVEEIANLEGFTKLLAEKVYEHFHPKPYVVIRPL